MGIEQLAEQMIGGRTEECWASLMEQVESGRNSLYIYEQWLAPAMRYVGSLWEQNLITVAYEHLASCVCDILLTRYAGLVKPDVIETPSLGDAGFFFITGTWMT
ncbi:MULTISPECIES: B12-binding domain-containing protein [unclassified Paenibacillus]|uniref:B12-binding domain-containing protein n=1 Tax=unclassified Paenibacillus TaxID=185978 RepID=UPI0015E3F41C|nr:MULTISPECIES: B12-binding domain-containing protein [unclassified Paenibacillus]MBJ9991689.1 B12-binding domain-containing protein [Paenibacillus sp. S28]